MSYKGKALICVVAGQRFLMMYKAARRSQCSIGPKKCKNIVNHNRKNAQADKNTSEKM